MIKNSFTIFGIHSLTSWYKFFVNNAPRIDKCDQHSLDTRLLEAKFLSPQRTQTNPSCTSEFTFRVVGKTPWLVTSYNFIQKFGIIVAHLRRSSEEATRYIVWNEQNTHFLPTSALIIISTLRKKSQSAFSCKRAYLIYEKTPKYKRALL